MQSIWQNFQKKVYFGVNEIINYVATKFEPHMMYIAPAIKVGRLGKSVSKMKKCFQKCILKSVFNFVIRDGNV